MNLYDTSKKKKIKTKRRERELPEKRAEGSWQSAVGRLGTEHCYTKQSAFGSSTVGTGQVTGD